MPSAAIKCITKKIKFNKKEEPKHKKALVAVENIDDEKQNIKQPLQPDKKD